MKKKVLSLLMCLSIVATMVGCTSSEVAPAEAASTETAEATETPTPIPTEEPEPEPEYVEAYILELPNDDFNNADRNIVWNSNIFSYQNAEGNWGVINAAGMALIEPEESTLYGYRCDDDTVIMISEKNNTITAYDKNGNEFVNESIPEGYNFYGYSDGLFVFYSNDSSYIIEYANENGKWDRSILIDQDYIPGLYSISIPVNGTFRITSNMVVEFAENRGVFGIIGYADYDSDFNCTFQMCYTEDGNYIQPFSGNNCVNPDGWIGANQIAPDTLEMLSAGFYNINTQEFVAAPYDGFNYFSTYGYNGERYVVADHYVDICENIDGESTERQRIFDLNKGDFIGDEYMSITLGDFLENKYILVENFDEKWGYCDHDMNPVSGFWDDATNFQNGYALINIDGMEYVINEDFEIVSETGFEAEVASGYSNTFGYSFAKGLYSMRTEDEEGNILTQKILVVNDPK